MLTEITPQYVLENQKIHAEIKADAKAQPWLLKIKNVFKKLHLK